FSSRRRHTRFSRDWSSDVCSSDLQSIIVAPNPNWRMATPEEADEWMMSRGFDIPVRRMVGMEQEVPAEVLQALGAGTHDFVLSEIGRASCREREWMRGVAGAVRAM